MSYSELVRAVADRAGVPLSDTRNVLDALIEEIRHRLVGGEAVTLWGLGRLVPRRRASRVVRAVGSRRRMFVGERNSARFRPSAALDRAMNANGDSWRTPETQSAWRLAETLLDDLDLYHGALAPTGLDEAASAETAERQCAKAFGAHWDRVVRTWESKRDPSVQTRFLGVVALRRWA